MTSLSTLSLRNCRIGGQIQEKLSSLLKLEKLDLSFNKLTGQIPASFKNFSSLQFLFLGSYGLSGELNLPYKSENNKFADLDPKTRSNVEKMMNYFFSLTNGRDKWAFRQVMRCRNRR